MTEENHSTLSAELDDLITQITRLNSQTRALLERSAFTIPTQYFGEFDQLSTTLTHLKNIAAQSEQARENLLALVDIGQAVNSSLKLKEVLQIVMDTIVKLLRAERGFLMLGSSKGKMVIHIARNWEQVSVHASDFAISRTIIKRVLSDKQPVLTTNAQADPRFEGQDSVIAYNLRSILCVPLKVKGKITGVIYADNRVRSGIFSNKEQDLLVAFADQAAVAIENARLFGSLGKSLNEVTEIKNLMDNVFSSMASGVITMDDQGRITLCNNAAQSILGIAKEDLLGKPIEQISTFAGTEFETYIQSVSQNNQYLTGIELETSTPLRKSVTIGLNLAPLKDPRQKAQGIAVVLEDLTEKKRLESQQRLFERMVSPAVIRQLDPEQLQLGGKRTEITTLFVDIRDFTRFSEKHEPEKLVSIVNRYLAEAADAILSYDGTIDKFLGDAVMAWFNAPIPQVDHTLRAVRAALRIQEAVLAVQKTLPVEYHLSFGAGLHIGEAVLGLVGTQKRLEYTALGDSINTAKRIQEHASAGQILMSAETYTQVASQVEATPAGAIQAKGKKFPLIVYELIGLK